MTELFIERGHTVAACARSAEPIAELSKIYGSPHFFCQADVSVESDVISFFEAAINRLGHAPDLVINNAAIINRNAALWEISAEEMSSIVNVNIEGVAHTIRYIVPKMIDRGSGVIVNFSSYWGRSTSSGVAPYCATKWAVEGLTSALADDLPAGLAAVAFNPGVIYTEMLRSCFGRAAASYTSPQQWAEKAVPFLENLGPGDNGKYLTAPGQ